MSHTFLVRFVLASTCMAALPALADSRFQARRMTRDDVPFGKGQCDIRLRVDGEVEVSVRGDSVDIRTFSGRDAYDAGSECNEPLPRNPRDFSFDVRDGRGGIRLLAPPSPRTGGAAVVRIRDSEGGAGRYHFRLSWEIGPGGGRERWDRDRDYRDDRDYRRDRGDDGRVGPPVGPGWNRRLYFTGRGDGVYQHDRFGRERIYNVVARLEPNGTVSVSFDRERRGRLNFTGRVTRLDQGDEVIAHVTGGDGDILRGAMNIQLYDNNRIRSIHMSGRDGRDSFEVRWRD